MNRHGQRLDAIEHCAAKRPRHRVAAHDDRVARAGSRIGEDSLQRVAVAVDVIQDENLNSRVLGANQSSGPSL